MLGVILRDFSVGSNSKHAKDEFLSASKWLCIICATVGG